MNNTLQKIYKAFNPPNEQLFLPNVHTPPKGSKGLRIKKTVQPGERASYSETFENINKQLTQ